MSHLIAPEDLYTTFDLHPAQLENRPAIQRRLSDLAGCFQNTEAYEAALRAANPVVYEVTSVEPASGDGQLHYGLGVLYPGRIGDEYFLTKGHYHAHRPAAEVYVGLEGNGFMLLEHDVTGASQLIPLHQRSVVYVPGHTAHRTINTGDAPLVYLGIYPANAGHDYAPIAERNFFKILVEREGQPALVDRPA